MDFDEILMIIQTSRIQSLEEYTLKPRNLEGKRTAKSTDDHEIKQDLKRTSLNLCNITISF